MGKISKLMLSTFVCMTFIGGYLEKTPTLKAFEKLHVSSLESRVGDVSSLESRGRDVSNSVVEINHYTKEELNEMQKVCYAEGANQLLKGRMGIAKVILNRVDSNRYFNNIYQVIHNKNNAFTCTFDGSKLWGQANGKIPMNEYEKEVFESCRADVVKVLNGYKIGIPRESEIIAYHDTSIKKPNDNYWNDLVEVFRSGKFVFYAPKTKYNVAT